MPPCSNFLSNFIQISKRGLSKIILPRIGHSVILISLFVGELAARPELGDNAP